MQSYPAKFSDEYGEDLTMIHNDGKTLCMNVRGVEFEGRCFNGFESNKNVTPQQLQTFFTTKPYEELCNYRLEFEMPVIIAAEHAEIKVSLSVKICVNETGDVLEDGLNLALFYDEKVFFSKGRSGWFEDELLDIQRQLPHGYYLKCCFGCAFSDYTPFAGHSVFGDMDCFRNTKEEYLAVKTKGDYSCLKPIESVQETYLCSEFEVRKPNTGYRG